MKSVTIVDPSKLYFASDHHFGHANIISHCSRPYYDVTEMDADLISRWNSVVPKDGLVIYMGDFTMNMAPSSIQSYLKLLNGTIRWHIYGNHDRRFEQSNPINSSDMLCLKVKDGDNTQYIHCCHYPIWSWYKLHRGSWHLYGHIHNSKHQLPFARAWNACVEMNDYSPFSYDLLKSTIADRVATMGDFIDDFSGND